VRRIDLPVVAVRLPEVLLCIASAEHELHEVSSALLLVGCPLQLLGSRLPSGASIADAAAEVAGQVRENIRVRRAFKLQTTTGERGLAANGVRHVKEATILTDIIWHVN
jgi:hypothetical protein